MKTQVIFYRVNDPFGCFSNFAPYPIIINNKTWPTSEHYFQAQKFIGTPLEEQIRQEVSPMNAAKLGRTRKYPIRADWETVKDQIMRDAVFAKFTQHSELSKILLETGDAEIIEHTENDSYWADGGDGTGKNMLGIILMELRDTILACTTFK